MTMEQQQQQLTVEFKYLPGKGNKMDYPDDSIKNTVCLS